MYGLNDILFLTTLVGIYFLPTIGAIWVKHKGWKTVLVANILVGWTGIGWFACMAWGIMPEIYDAKRWK